MQGLIRRFKHDIEKRIEEPEKYDPKLYFQGAWSGQDFDNQSWVLAHGGGKSYGA